MASEPRISSSQPSAIWLLTFTDLVALLLTFFVMLFSMSNVKIDRWKEMIDTLSQSLNPARAEPAKVPSAQYNISSVFRKRAINLDYLTAVLEQKIGRSEVLKNSLIVPLEDRLIISLPGARLFAAESAALNQNAGAALFDLGGVLRHIDNQIGVNGYSEEANVGETVYKSDWELSLARAVAVANELKRAGYGDQIVTFGFGNSHASKLRDLAEDKGRLLSRRVDIVIMAVGGEN
jgi:chemotaxis protein MotB